MEAMQRSMAWKGDELRQAGTSELVQEALPKKQVWFGLDLNGSDEAARKFLGQNQTLPIRQGVFSGENRVKHALCLKIS